MEAGNWNKIIDGKRYTTATATLIANDVFWDGHNYERWGRNRFLLRTKNGNYFTVTRTQWQGERDVLTPLSQDEAMRAWEELPEHLVTFEEAFPGLTVEEA